MALSTLASLHDVLVAWQAGHIGYREALDRARLDTLDELYEAAELSAVPLSVELDPGERSVVSAVAAILRGLDRQAA